jgi:Superinfection immunity protein
MSSSGISPLVLLALYFLPSIVAELRHMANRGSVFVVNLFPGWTFIGWIVALAMAAGNSHRELWK